MIDKLEKKFGKYAIRGLMKYVIVLYAAGFIMSVINPYLYYNWLMLDIDKVLEGQIWRIFTFIIQPVNTDNVFRVFLSLYVNFLFGMMLEGMWGSFRFNLYYFSGILFNALAGVAIYIFTSIEFGNGMSYPIDLTYLNLTLFLAFAVSFPENRFGFSIKNGISMFAMVYLLAVAVDVAQAFRIDTYTGMITLVTNMVWVAIFCMGPKGKHLAFAYLVLIVLEVVQGFSQGGYLIDDGNIYIISGWRNGVIILIAIVFSLLNFLIFFISLRKRGITPNNALRRQFMQASGRNRTHKPVRTEGEERGKIIKIYRPSENAARHKCAVCGRTEKDDESLEFRFCSKCNGNYEYCSDHLYTHTHVE